MNTKLKNLNIFLLFGILINSYHNKCHADDWLVNHLDLKYLGIFDGPSIINPSPFMPNNDGYPDFERPIQITNYLMTGYKIAPDISIGGLVTFAYFPFSDTSIKAFDPALRFTHRGLFKSENFKMVADLRVFIPTTDYSKKAEMVTSFQSFQMTEYSFPRSSWTIGSLSSLKFGFYKTSELEAQNWSLYLAPNFNYYLNNNVSLGIFTGATLSHYINKAESATVFEDPYLGPGANVALGEIFTISPAFIVPPHAPKFSNLSFLLFVVGKFY